MFLSPGVFDEIKRTGIPVCFFISDEWPGRWMTDEHAGWSRLRASLCFSPASFVARTASMLLRTSTSLEELQFQHCHLASEYLLRKLCSGGIQLNDAWVTHWGVDRERYLCERLWDLPAKRFLYAGQLSEHKGVHTGLEAFAIVAKANPHLNLTLTLAGAADNKDYDRGLSAIAAKHGVGDRIRRLGRVSELELAETYKSHDSLLFTSIWEEPFSIALVEGMTSGMAVLSTLTGGTGELVRNNINALVFPPGDLAECVRQFERLTSDAELCRRLSIEAVNSTSCLTLTQLVDSIESHFAKLVNKRTVA